MLCDLVLLKLFLLGFFIGFYRFYYGFARVFIDFIVYSGFTMVLLGFLPLFR